MCKLCEQDVLGSSPFGKVVFLGFDDGPTSGAVKCYSTPAAYRFEMLERDLDGKVDWERWDRGEEIRIFSLAPMEIEAFNRFSVAFLEYESRRAVGESDITDIFDEPCVPEFVIASTGINTAIIAVRPVSEVEIKSVTDWFSFLGFR